MSEWPTGWFRREDGAERGDGQGAPGGGNTPGAGDPAARRHRRGTAGCRTTRPSAAATARQAGSAAASRATASAAATPGRSRARGRISRRRARRPGPRGPGRPRGGLGGRRRRPRLRLVLAFLAGLVVVLLILVIGGYFYLDGKLNRQNVLVSYSGQPAAGAGTNWLITGSDSRQGLTRKQERKYHTGMNVAGQRSDTIMLLHIPGNGGPAVLVSLPRDSYRPDSRVRREQAQRRLFVRRPETARPDRAERYRPAHRALHGNRVRRPGECGQRGRRGHHVL